MRAAFFLSGKLPAPIRWCFSFSATYFKLLLGGLDYPGRAAKELMEIRYLENPGGEEKQAILGPLMAHNLQAGPDPDYRQFAFLLRDTGNRTAGGLWGRTAYDWAVIELLFVPEDMRGTGIGRTLAEKAEGLARGRQCSGIWLDSFGFQAPGFYTKLGYEVSGELCGNPAGQNRYFLRKMLG